MAHETARAEWWRLIPREATADARWVIGARGLRAVGDGLVSVLPPTYLLDRGFDVFTVGILSTVTLLGTCSSSLRLLGQRGRGDRAGRDRGRLTGCVARVRSDPGPTRRGRSRPDGGGPRSVLF